MSKYPQLNGLKGGEYRSAWNKLHRELMREVGRKHRINNPEKYQQYRRKQHDRHMAQFNMAVTSRINLEFKAQAHQSYQRWTDREDRLLMEGGLTYRQAAKALHRSLRAVMNRKHKLKAREVA